MSAKDKGKVSRPSGAVFVTAKDSVATALEKMEKAQDQAPRVRGDRAQAGLGADIKMEKG